MPLRDSGHVLVAVAAVLILLVSVILVAPAVHATTYTWDAGGDYTWNNTANWGPNHNTVPTGSDTASFAGSGSASPVTVSGTQAVGQIQFSAGGYTLSGDTLSLGGTVTQIQVSAAVTDTVSSGITLQTAANTLTLDVAGGGTLYLNGLLNGFSGGLTKTSGGTLVLGAATLTPARRQSTAARCNLG